MGPDMHEGSKLHPTNTEVNTETRTDELAEPVGTKNKEQLEEKLTSLGIEGIDDPEPIANTSRSTDTATRLISAMANKNHEFTNDVKDNVEASRTTQEHEQPSDQSSRSKDRVHHSSTDTEPRSTSEQVADRHKQPEASDKRSPQDDTGSSTTPLRNTAVGGVGVSQDATTANPQTSMVVTVHTQVNHGHVKADDM